MGVEVGDTLFIPKADTAEWPLKAQSGRSDRSSCDGLRRLQANMSSNALGRFPPSVNKPLSNRH